MQELPLRVLQDPLADELAGEVGFDDPGEGFRRDVECGGVMRGRMGGNPVPDELDKSREDGVRRRGSGRAGRHGRSRWAGLFPRASQARGFDEEDLEQGDEDFGMSKARSADFRFHLAEELGEFRSLRGIDRHHGLSVDVVEEDAIAADGFVVSLDAEEIRVELEDGAAHWPVRGEEEGLIGIKEEERGAAKGVAGKIGMEDALPLGN